MTPEQFAAFSDPFPDLMLLSTAEGRVLAGNRELASRVGVARADLAGRFVSDLVGDAQSEVSRFLRSCTRSRQFVITSLNLRDSQGDLLECRAEGALVRPRAAGEEAIVMIRLVSKESAIGQFAALNRQIEDLNNEIQRRLRAEAALKEANRLKDEFLATLAHELRNPLAPVRSALLMMKMAGNAPAVVEESRALMERQVAHMVRLIDDLMDVSRINRGRLEIRKQTIDLSAIVTGAVEASRPLVETYGHTLTTTLPDQSVTVEADLTRMIQVVSNLLNNAARYTPQCGRIALTVQAEGSDVVLSVKDNGIGIKPEMLPRIFDMFTQVDESLERSRGGLGIGLSLVKTLVEMHGGSIRASSEGLGLGSEFVVRLPIVVATKPGPKAPSEPMMVHAAPPRRILLVDDNRDSARIMGRILRMYGHQIQTASDGREAVDMAETFRPDLIFLDIGLPLMSGHEVAREIRSRPWGDSVMIVAVTGWGLEADRQKSRQAGIDLHYVKPISHETMMSILAASRSDPDPGFLGAAETLR